jgi:hypothetical protein
MNSRATAPIALFAYNRPQHIRKTVEALQGNDLAEESDLYAYCDGPRDAAAVSAVHAVRDYLRTVKGFRSVSLVEREFNLGLAQSVITAVTDVCARHGRIIAVEDDLETSPYFLRYMNDALDRYAGVARVGSIHGYWYPVGEQCPETFFLRGASCWGWATWSRSWSLFESDGRTLLAALQERNLTHRFDLDGAIRYTQMLRDQIEGANDSWAIRWHASMFLADCLQLSPGTSLVRNIGFDGSGTHCDQSDAYAAQLADQPVDLCAIPLEESVRARQALIQYYRASRPTFAARVVRRLRRATGI